MDTTTTEYIEVLDFESKGCPCFAEHIVITDEGYVIASCVYRHHFGAHLDNYGYAFTTPVHNTVKSV